MHDFLSSPELAAEAFRRSKAQQKAKPNYNADIKKRLHEIDRQINKLMELYKIDSIPADVLGDSINKLYQEKIALQNSFLLSDEVDENSFLKFYEILGGVAKEWDFADESQKRRLLQGLIVKITLTDDNVDIEWVF